jgi:hypothetical protein
MKEFLYQSRLWLARSPTEIFPYFADAKNLGNMTPPWLHFEILTPGQIEMAVGTLIDSGSGCMGSRWDGKPGSRFGNLTFDLSMNRSKGPINAGFTNTVLRRAAKEPCAVTKSDIRFWVVGL